MEARQRAQAEAERIERERIERERKANIAREQSYRQTERHYKKLLSNAYYYAHEGTELMLREHSVENYISHGAHYVPSNGNSVNTNTSSGKYIGNFSCTCIICIWFRQK